MINLSNKHKAILEKIFSDIIPHMLAIKIYLFGSRVLGTAKPASDIDLAFECLSGEKMPFSLFLNLGIAFEESDLPLFVDMIDMNNTSENIKQEIIRTGCLIWQR